MTSAEELARHNRQMVAERAALLAERDRLQAAINQRSADTVGEFIDGLDVFCKLAASGHSPAKEMLRLLCERLEAARALAAGIALANGRQS